MEDNVIEFVATPPTTFAEKMDATEQRINAIYASLLNK
jgi:hypothetical protein